MNTATVSNPASFTKVGPCLYRYIPSGKYYAKVKSAGKEIRKCLGTTDRKYAERKLREDWQAQADCHLETRVLGPAATQ